MNKKKLILIIALSVVIIAGIIVGVVIAVGNGSNNPPTSTTIIWKDSVTPEEQVDPEITSPAVKYPQKPETEPVINENNPVTVGDLTASDSCYDIQSNEGVWNISYNSVESLPHFAYIYVPVENYQSKYHYLKIKATATGVQRITIVAVYYEQYAQNRPGVTVYNNAVLEGENTILCDLNESVILNEHYDTVIGEKLVDKKICGFMLMIDSNPKQVIDDFQGEISISSVAVVDETDPDLALLYAPPTISGWSTTSADYTVCDITTSTSENTGSVNASIDYSFSSGFPFIQASIYNYKSDYTTLKLRIKGMGVKNLTIAIKYTLSTSSTSGDYNYISSFGMQVPTDWETMEFDFSTLEELTSDFVTTIPGSYVKNLKPTALYFFIDTAIVNAGDVAGGTGTLYVEDVEFIKPVDDGTPKVTGTWTVTGDGMAKSNVEAGGIGTLTYDKTQGWTAVTVNVSAYNPEFTTLVVKVKFYGAKNLGIALGYGSSNTVIQNSDGNTDTGVKLTHTQESGSDDKGDYVFHTYEIDFSAVNIAAGGKLSEQSINKIMFYIDSVIVIEGNSQEVAMGSSITPRTMQFVGIEFKKPATEDAE